MRGLSVSDLHKAFDGKPALRGVSLEIPPGQVAALLGPSGCGKSTLLMLVAGLDAPDAGQIAWDGTSLAGTPPHQRGFGLMFQDYALFPHLNVQDNVAFGLKTGPRRAKKLAKDVQARVSEMLKLVGLEGYERRDVNTLSGGEQQRVALARSMAPRPRFLMLDEPLGALDRGLRERLVFDLRRILRQLGQTALYVTHDQEEAFTLADQVILLNAGRVEQAGAPQDLYRRPATPFVARFLGFTNLFEARLSGDLLETPLGSLPLPAGAPNAPGPLTMLLRPDEVRLGEAGPYTLNGVVQETAFRGASCRATVHVGEQNTAVILDLPPGECLPGAGARVALSFNPDEAIQIFANQ